MKKLLQSRGAAIVVTVVLCLVFAVLGMNRSVAREAEKCTRTFYEGVEADGYTSASMYSILKSIDTYSLTLSSVLADVPELDDARQDLVEARRDLVDAMEAKDIRAMYGADNVVSERAKALMDQAESAALSQGDREKADEAYQKLSSAQGALERNPYRERCEIFQRSVMGSLPVRLLRGLIFVDGPQSFSFQEQ